MNTELLQHTWGLRPKCCPTCGAPKFKCPVFVDTTTGEAFAEGVALDLTPKVLQILEAIARAYPRGVSKDALLRHVWPEREFSSQTSALLNQHIHRVRRELLRKGLSVRVWTVHGAGYALNFGDRP